ncbi:hypothetical protein [Lunatimonas salinarum]|uniref:hypothetical protein n=1 Tax=Lunatimonas salinarum TaxID=1774590 RepID=UPI001ADF6CD6|nr:hypothetical protein [Lunatimonas salinarum]
MTKPTNQGAMTLQERALFLPEGLFVIAGEQEKLLFAERVKRSLPLSTSEQPQVNEPVEEYEEEAYHLSYEGGFKKKILVLFMGAELEAPLKVFLLKILGAVECTAQDIALTSEIALKEAGSAGIQSLDPEKIIAFGKIDLPIPLSKKNLYEIISEDDKELLFADSLEELIQDTDLKRKLWNSLQSLFNIKQKK